MDELKEIAREERKTLAAIGFVDASVAAIAERLKIKTILTAGSPCQTRCVWRS